MNILGIHDGHTATACLLKDGVLAAMASEERFNRKKSWGGAPSRATRWVLESTRTDPSTIDAVALSWLVQPTREFSIRGDFPPNTVTPVARFLPQWLLASDAIVAPYVNLMSRFRNMKSIVSMLDGLGVPHVPIQRVEHHLAHAAAGYYLSSFAQEQAPTLVITLDGSGDGLSGTVSIGRGHSLERQLALSSYHSPGLIYSLVTQYLGMKPAEHEYKVMGLAPYAPEELAEQARKIFAGYFSLSPDGLRIVNTSGAWGPGFIQKLERDMRRIRFDAVAAGAQLHLEDVIVKFIRNWINRTGVRTVAIGGGLFMNVKLNMLIQNMPEVERVFFMPSGGDESLAMGAATWVAAQRGESHIQPIDKLYLGPEFSCDEIEAALRQFQDRVCWERVDQPEVKAAELLVQGRVVGRFAGRMEWGARALGNRSILADGRDLAVIRKINAAIKQRDFWMPFAPSILWERRNDYLVNPRGVDAPYMILAFPSTPLAQQHLRSALHQYDLSCRPQLVREETNPHYHRLLKEWERLTGCGGLLNTSFNLHGEPIVCTPQDALETLLRSEIDDLMMENFLVRRKSTDA
jgi:carbamoyltransferase